MSERIPLTRHDAPRCKDCWHYIPMTIGKQGSINGKCNVRNSRTDLCGGRNQYNKACRKVNAIEPTATVTVHMEVNKARMDEYLAIIESMLYCGVIKSLNPIDKDVTKAPLMIFKDGLVVYNSTYDKKEILEGLKNENVASIEVYLKGDE